MFLLAATLAFASLPSGVQRLLTEQGVGPERFPSFVQQIETDTARRLAEGENEHLVFFVLQSRAFTTLAPVEPALSAKEWRTTGTIPKTFEARAEAFIRGKASGARMVYLKGLLPAKEPLEFLHREYRRTMQGLYAKEFEAAPEFYRVRGHSTDTNVAANYAVWNALQVLKGTMPGFRPGFRVDRVLVVGPGLDFAPRTGFDESAPPQSYQPFAIADALLGLGLSSAPQIDCMDINPRVIQYFHDLSAQLKPELRISSIPGEPDYLDYFRRLGRFIGAVRETGDLEKRLALRGEIVQRVSAFQGNIITTQPEQKYDLVIATNVLVYCSDLELLLATANISGSLKPGGFFVMNEIRPAMDRYAPAAGLTPLQARTVKIAEAKVAPLFDAFALYQKR